MAARLLAQIIRFPLGAVFLFSGLSKIRLPYDFLAVVSDYRILNAHAAALVAATLPWIEATCGMCLLIDIMLPGAFALAGCLAMVFLAAVTSVLVRHMRVSCGCFMEDDLVSAQTIMRSSILLICSIAGLYGVNVKKGSVSASPAT